MSKQRASHKQALRQLLDRHGIGPLRQERGQLIDQDQLIDEILRLNDRGGANVPAARYAAAYKLQPQPVTGAWMSGPHRAVVPDEALLGLPIVSRVCPVWHDIAITVRHRKDVPPAALEVVLLGTVLSEAEGFQTYLKEQQVLEQAWKQRASRACGPGAQPSQHE